MSNQKNPPEDGILMIDYYQFSIWAIMSVYKDLGDNPKEGMKRAILSGLLQFEKTYSKKYPTTILAIDAGNYWRKDLFPYYKGGRKSKRDKSPFDWKTIYLAMKEMSEELVENFPYYIVKVEKCEADDIIAILCKYYSEQEEPKPILIISSDKDFCQLQKYPGIRQFSPYTKRLMDYSQKEVGEYTMEHIVKGDSGDGIPNILSEDNFFTKEGRQLSITSRRLESFYKLGYNACIDEDERTHYKRNEALVSFEKIPGDISENILKSYSSIQPVKSKKRIMDYLIKNRMTKEFLQDLDFF